MLKAFKTEINPTLEQIGIINKTLGVCRFVYNLYIAENQERYAKGEEFISGMNFSVWLNNEFVPNNSDKSWIKDVYAKAVKQSIMNGDKAYRRFFEKKKKPGYIVYSKKQKEHAARVGKILTVYDMQGHPKFKRKNDNDVKMYFVRNGINQPISCERHRIKVPTLGWVRLKEKGFIPTDLSIISGTISKVAGRFYVSVLIDIENVKMDIQESEGVGIDLGVNELAVMSNGVHKKNINKTVGVKKLNKKLKREQQRLSRKYESLKNKKYDKEGGGTRRNIQKQVLKVQRLHQRIINIREDYQNKIINELVKTKPAYIVIENLNVRGMMKNRHLSKAVGQQGFYKFRINLESKCKQFEVELRVVDRFYPSSKLCHECGQIKSDLKLSDRLYICDCGYKVDRDYNASLNLRDARTYKLA